MSLKTDDWNEHAFKDVLIRLIEKKERYRAEHVARLARGQANGNARMRDMLSGEIKALESILAHDLSTAKKASKEISACLKGGAPLFKSIENPASAAAGWSMALREVLVIVADAKHS